MEDSGKKGLAVGGMALLALLKFGAMAARHSTHSTSTPYSSRSASLVGSPGASPYVSPYQSPYASPLARAALQEELGRLDTRREDERLKRELIEQLDQQMAWSCRSMDVGQLRLEVELDDPFALRVYKASLGTALHGGAVFPAAMHVAGLEVLVMRRGADGTDAPCVDGDDALAATLAARESWPTGVVASSPGVWVFKTMDKTATRALLVADVGARLKTRGALIAFAPNDDLVVFADGANADAVTAAARVAMPKGGAQGDGSCTLAAPVVLEGGRWRPYSAPASHPAAPALRAFHAAAHECQVEMAADGVKALGSVKAVLALIPGQFDRPVPSLEEFDAAPRTWSAASGSLNTVKTGADEDAQVLGRSDRVAVEGADGKTSTLAWAEFARRFKKSLEPLSYEGQVVPEYFVLRPEGALVSRAP